MMAFTIFLVFLMIFSLLVMLVAIWALHAIDKTGKQRLNILDSIRYVKVDSTHERMEHLNSFDTVSFDEHYNKVFWMQDPYKLYPIKLQNIIKEK